MEGGKPAGVRCVQLDGENRCKLFGKPERPKVCLHLHAEEAMCGDNFEQAMHFLSELEILTQPS